MKIRPTRVEFSEGKPLIIGKRVNMAAAIGSAATVFSILYPDNAQAIIAASVPLTYVAQVLVVNVLGITTVEG